MTRMRVSAGVASIQPSIYPPIHSSIHPCRYQWVDTEEALDDMCAHIATVTEVAVDLEHHSFHSFLGFVCLMQVRG